MAIPSISSRVQETPEVGGKLTTAKLAEKLGLQTTALFNKLIGRGYLELTGYWKPLKL